MPQARSNELRAVLDYNKSQVDFETVQIAPTGGTSSFGPTTGATTTLGGAVTGATAGEGLFVQSPSARCASTAVPLV